MQIARGFRESSKADIAVAYVTEKGLDSIRSSINRAANKKSQIRILVGLSSDAFNEPRALRRLLELHERRKIQFGISALKNRFHQKTYIFSGKKKPMLIIGSSNLTEKALKGEGELNVLIIPENRGDQRFFSQVQANFTRNWSNACRDIGILKKIIARYEKKRGRSRAGGVSPRDWRSISKLIGKSEELETKSRRRRAWSAWYVCLNGYLKDKTDSAIKEEFGWEEKDYSWCSISKDVYEQMLCAEPFGGKEILFVWDKKEMLDWLLLYSIKDIDRLPRAVVREDGRHFLAFPSTYRSRKKFSSEFKDALIGEGFVRSRNGLKTEKKISSRYLKTFLDNFNLRV
jgi:HKD family nuclease